jgi:hypothetical protein
MITISFINRVHIYSSRCLLCLIRYYISNVWTVSGKMWLFSKYLIKFTDEYTDIYILARDTDVWEQESGTQDQTSWHSWVWT